MKTFQSLGLKAINYRRRELVMKKIRYGIAILTTAFFLSGCTTGSEGATTESKSELDTEEALFTSVSAEEAKQIMDSETGYMILDVRTKEEYESGHIINATLLPNEEIGEDVSDILPEKEQKILVYCRSGNRSKQASEKLVKLGYTNIVEFGGIADWPYEIEKTE